MLKISDAVKEITQTPFFQFGLSNQLINLTRMAHFIHPMVEARTKKEVSPQAILMTLSRLQKTIKKISEYQSNFKVESITIESNLTIITFQKTEGLHKKINLLYNEIQKINGYITITEGINEITLIIEDAHTKTAEKIIKETPKNRQNNIASIGVKFDNRYGQTPGVLHEILQKIATQNINIIEITSTYTEFIIYVELKDAKLTADTLFNCLIQSGRAS